MSRTPSNPVPFDDDADFARRIIVGHSADDAAAKCAAYLAQCIQEATETVATVTVAFSGGSTPRLMFDHLARLAGTGTEGPYDWWRAVEVFQVDERIAPDGDPARNANDLLHALLDPTHVAAERRHLMPVLSITAAQDYETTVDRLAPSGIDIVVLGLGDDGHTASLVPGDPVVEERVALVAKTGPYRGHARITLTRSCLDAAGRAIWLVSGASKANALARLIAFDETIPASLIRTPSQIVFTDPDAAGLTNPVGPAAELGERCEAR